LDIRALHRQGALNGEEHWRLLRYERGWLLLVMTYQEGALEVELSGRDRQVIPIGWTPCYYGGRRPWFHCRWCGHRVAVLYGSVFTLRCHRCSHRPYASQCTTAEDRQYHRVRTIRARLGASPNLGEPIDPATKPKGMHWRTWERLCAQEAAVHRRFLQRLLATGGPR
jgi:hypothetical protein